MKQLLLLLVSCLLICCVKKKDGNPVTPQDTTSVTTLETETHNSSNSLDYLGFYKGILPCADCEGIETTLELMDEGVFELKTRYIGENKPGIFTKKGSYSWSEDGNSIRLNGITDGPSQYKVTENALVQLDMSGAVITGGLADKYILSKADKAVDAIVENTVTKPSENATVKPKPKPTKPAVVPPTTKPLPKPQNYSLAETYWRLTELNGKPVSKAVNTKEYFMRLTSKDARIQAFAGCNNIMGGYQMLNTTRLSFSKIATTRKMCPNIQLEKDFVKVLETVDNYSLKGNKLSLSKARMAPLARFEAMSQPPK